MTWADKKVTHLNNKNYPAEKNEHVYATSLIL